MFKHLLNEVRTGHKTGSCVPGELNSVWRISVYPYYRLHSPRTLGSPGYGWLLSEYEVYTRQVIRGAGRNSGRLLVRLA